MQPDVPDDSKMPEVTSNLPSWDSFWEGLRNRLKLPDIPAWIDPSTGLGGSVCALVVLVGFIIVSEVTSKGKEKRARGKSILSLALIVAIGYAVIKFVL